MITLQRLYIFVFNRVYLITGRVERKKMEWALQIVCFLFPVYFLMIYGGLASKLGIIDQFSRHIVGLCILFLLIIFSIDRQQGTVRWRPIVYIPLILCGIGIFIISIIHPVGEGYRVFAFMLIFVFPGLFFIWNNRRDYDRLYYCMSVAIGVVGIVYMIICLICSGLGLDMFVDGRFRGTLSHSGNLSLFYTSVFCSGIYLLLQDLKNRKMYLFSLVIIAIGTGMLALGQGRSCVLAALTCLVSAIFFAFRYDFFSLKRSFGGVFKRMIEFNTVSTKQLIFTILILFFVVFAILTATAASYKAFHQPVPNTNGTTESQISAGDQIENDPDKSDITERFSTKGKDINDFSSGRIDLWKLVAQHLNMIGNDVDKMSIRDLTQNPRLIYAHNVFLEISYRCGIPVGLIFIFLQIIVGVIALRYLFFNTKRERFLIYPIMFVIFYMYESMFDCAGMPFILECSCYYYFSMIPMMDRSV